MVNVYPSQLVTDQPQTFHGVKEFVDFPITPSSAPTTDYQVANKKYVDDQGDGIQFVDVTLTPAQILDMRQNPVEILPAPGPNKIIQTVNSIVEYSVCEGGTTDYSPVTGAMLLMIGQGFGYNPSFCNSYQSRSVAGNITYSALGQTGYLTPQSPNIYSYLSFFNYITNPANKPVNAWLVYDINNPYTPPTVGDRNVTFRYNYRILDLAFTPYLPTFPTAFTLKTICNPSSAYAPFDGTETNWAVTRLYTSSSYSILPDFVLNPVYEGAGVWNLGDGLYNAPFSTSTSIGNQGYWAVQFSCIKGGQTISFTSRGTFPGAVGAVATFNVAYTA